MGKKLSNMVIEMVFNILQEQTKMKWYISIMLAINIKLASPILNIY
jgi:hypothetical protein